MRIRETKVKKGLFSDDYNFIFNKENGFFIRWGKNLKDDPQCSPFGAEILDLEISSGGDCKGNCPFCYKSNGGDQPTHNMTFDEFKTIFNKMPHYKDKNGEKIPLLTQIAFGIMDISTNPDFFRMMEYAKEHGVIPNYTCNGLEVTEEVAKKTAELCGAVAVSLVNKEKTYEAIKKFSIDNNMTQCNMHYMLSLESYDRAFDIIDDLSTDPRLKNFNAIVFLQYKAKGRNPDGFNSILDVEKYAKLTNYCEEKKIQYGFDSCSAPIFIDSLEGKKDKSITELFVEPCESGLFSSYINCYGKFFVCSFAEGEDKWKEGLDVLNCNDFMKDIWNHPRLIKWRERLIGNKRSCPIYDLEFVKK